MGGEVGWGGPLPLWEGLPSPPTQDVTIFSKPYMVRCDLVRDFSLFLIYVASLTKRYAILF